MLIVPIAVLVLLLSAASAQAAAGDLDPAFSGDGRANTDFAFVSDSASAVVVQTDGKLVAAGSAFAGTSYDFALERLTPGGQLDQTFGRRGKVTTDFGAADYEQALAIQLDGKLVVAGWTYNGSNDDFALARFNPDGTLDQTSVRKAR